MTHERPENVDWTGIYCDAVRLVRRVHPRDAEDVVQQAIERVLAEVDAYDPQGGGTLAEHVAHVALGVQRSSERADRRRRGIHTRVELESGLRAGSPTPEDTLGDAEEQARALERLLSRIRRDGDALEIVRLTRLGIDDAEEQAQESGWDMPRVRNTRRRIQRHVEKLSEDSDADNEVEEVQA